MTRIFTIALTVWLEMIRRKDMYVLLILLAGLMVTLVSLDIFGLGGVTGYVKDMGLLIAWLLGWILAITVASRELPQEESSGTVFPLLAKPVTRFDVVAGKWLGAWTIVCAAVLLFYALIIGVVLAKGGGFNAATLLQGFVLHCAVLAMLSAVALAFSTRMNHDAAATISFVLSTASFLVIPRIPEFMTNTTGLRAGLMMFCYNLLPHFEVFDMRMLITQGYDPISGKAFVAILAYGATMTLIALLAAWLAYRNKRFVRGDLAQ
jgi:ABC-type transport system involved in multi-copper enzyme maturation permease subunit